MSNNSFTGQLSTYCPDYLDKGHPYPAFVARIDGILIAHNDALQQLCAAHDLTGMSAEELGVEHSLWAALPMQWKTTRIVLQFGAQRCLYQVKARRHEQYVEFVCIAEVEENTNALLGMTALNNELVNLTRQLRMQNEQLEKAHRVIHDLRELLPMCAGCHSIRDEEGAWHPVADYLIEHTGTTVSHGLCPKCLKRYYPDIAD